MRIGIFGGTFDPPHVGHLIAALDACDLLRLDRLVFVPAAAQPLKRADAAASPEHRAAMVELVAALDQRFSVDRLEVDRGGLSFTVDTLRALRVKWPEPAWQLVLLLGADAAAQFGKWRDPEGVRSLATVAVLTRGAPAEAPGFAVVPSRRVDVSSTEVRERVGAGKAICGLVTDPVAAYIAAHGLYH